MSISKQALRGELRTMVYRKLTVRLALLPYKVGNPGYRAGLDRDGDGVACE